MNTWPLHNAGIFSLELPPGWLVEHPSPSMLLVQDPQSKVALSFTAILRATVTPDAPGELGRWMRAQPEVRPLQPPRMVHGGPYPTATCEGVQVEQAPAKKLFSWLRARLAKRFVHWRFWSLVHGSTALLVSSNGPAASQERYRATIDQIVSSVKLSAIVPTRKEAERVEPWGTAKGKVLPVLMTAEAVHNAPLPVVHEPWVNGLEIAYSLGGQEVVVTTGDLVRWKLSAEEVHAQAVANLVSQTHDHAMQGQKGEGFTVLCLGLMGGGAGVPAEEKPAYVPGEGPEVLAAAGVPEAGAGAPVGGAAARILLPELHRKLREHLGATFFAAIPTRELLMAFSVEDPTLLGKFRKHVEEEYGRAGSGAALSPKLFLVTPDGIAGDPEEVEEW